jgi:hypothetical protein
MSVLGLTLLDIDGQSLAIFRFFSHIYKEFSL